MELKRLIEVCELRELSLSEYCDLSADEIKYIERHDNGFQSRRLILLEEIASIRSHLAKSIVYLNGDVKYEVQKPQRMALMTICRDDHSFVYGIPPSINSTVDDIKKFIIGNDLLFYLRQVGFRISELRFETRVPHYLDSVSYRRGEAKTAVCLNSGTNRIQG